MTAARPGPRTGPHGTGRRGAGENGDGRNGADPGGDQDGADQPSTEERSTEGRSTEDRSTEDRSTEDRSTERPRTPDDLRAAERERWARAAWSGLAEPGDVLAGVLVDALGAAEAWRWVAEDGGALPTALTADGSSDGWATSASGTVRGGATRGSAGAARLARALERWAPRAQALRAAGWSPDGPPDRAGVGGVGARAVRVVVPGDADWPAGLDALGHAAPHCLWVRGDSGALASGGRAVALVGARAATTYGERVAVDLAGGLVDARFVVVSGGAYGIDAAAHRGVCARAGRTVVVTAGGVDRAYPAGNARLVEESVACGGAVVAEVPPSSLPTRSRFLQRNRLIAALSAATVVVEAAWRSGALSTAHHAARLARPVGAVPGPVTSMASAGCHRLLRDGVAVCVTDAAEVIELAGDLGSDAAPETAGAAHVLDGVDEVGRRVHDALSTRAPRPVDVVARAAGVTVGEARSALGLLELSGLARRDAAGWRTSG